ncbi:M23 family metallopeptidase [Microbacterium sp. NPDC096154]|uniref:M23 family metallopeptidase n=1 Tax=Microbacterium sp. NPDC096154 TaxID=3155549 RepID=UPI00331E441B
MSQIDSSSVAPDTDQTTSLVPARTETPVRTKAGMRAVIRKAEREARRAGAPRVRPLRAIGTVAAVGALIAGVAFPAYAAIKSDGTAVTMHDVAAGEAQSLVVASEVESPVVTGSSYAATTPEELEKAAAEKAAAERAKQQAAAAAAAAASAPAVASAPATSYAAPAAVSGGFGSPLPGGSYYISRSVGSGHQGTDMVCAAGTPIYAVTSGTVVTAGWSGAYGNLVTFTGNVNGSGVEVRNAHMSSIAVSPGQTVQAGQVIGYVGSTGRSTANHLHIEVRINGGLVDPMGVLPI